MNSEVEFLSTEHFEILGSLDKSSVRGDLVANIKNISENKESTNKIIIELQSTKYTSMGFRMFVYSINVANVEEETQTYTFPEPLTIYTVLGKSKSGTDLVNFKIKNFSVDTQEFSADNGDVLTIKFPFVNLFAIEHSEFENSPIEPLKIIYPYKYKQNPNLIKKDLEEFEVFMKKLKEYVINQKEDKIYIAELLSKILVDLINKCEENPDKYKKELEIMADVNKTSIDIYGDKREAKGKLEEKLEIAKNLLGKLADLDIADVTGLPISQIEKLRVNY